MNPRRRPQGSESHAVPSGGNHNDGRFRESLSSWHDGVCYLKTVLLVTLTQRMYYIVLQLSMQELVETRQGPFGNEKIMRTLVLESHNAPFALTKFRVPYRGKTRYSYESWPVEATPPDGVGRCGWPCRGDGEQQRNSKSEVREASFVRPSSLMKGFATVDEVATMATYLASELSSTTDGAALRADGGVVSATL
jgi:hypothetical protein